MSKLLTAIGLILMVGGLAYHFAALAIFNALVPKDSGSRLAASDVAYGAGPRQRLDVYVPEGQGPFPVIVFSYGGSWDSGSKNDYGFVGRALASRGYVVAIPDYRLVPTVRYPVFVDDVAAVIGWANVHAGEFGGDARRLFAVGHSAGAYNLIQAILRNNLEAKLKAVVTLAGPFDFLPLDSPKSIAAFSGVADLEETQPVNADLSAAPPVLLLHGSADRTVRIRNSENLHAALRKAGRPTELKIYQDVNHADIMLALSTLLRSRAPALDDAIAFFQKYD
jgi:acetyl esterase/lipase